MHVFIPCADGRTPAGTVAVVLGHGQSEGLGRDDEAPSVVVSGVGGLIDMVVTPVHVSTEPIGIQVAHHVGITIDVKFEQELVAEVGLVTPNRVVHIVRTTVNPNIAVSFLVLLVELHVGTILSHVGRLGPKCVFAGGDNFGKFGFGVGEIALPDITLAFESVACLLAPTASDSLLATKSGLAGKVGSSLVELLHDPCPTFLCGSVARSE